MPMVELDVEELPVDLARLVAERERWLDAQLADYL
jgi:hypothetical protein